MNNEELLASYRVNHDKDALHKLIKNYNPLIRKNALKFSANIPQEVLELEGKIIVKRAIDSYNPALGSLSGHIDQNLKGLHRIANSYSPVYIPETRVNIIGAYKDEIDILENTLKRPPTYAEIADKMSIPVSEIKKLSQEVGRSLIAEGDMPDYIEGMGGINANKLLEFVYNKTTDPKERKVIEMTYGLNNTPIAKNNKVIALQLGVSETTVRNLKDNIINNIKRYE
jgi:DNA-directed RNA polymerase specialized sigma subunit